MDHEIAAHYIEEVLSLSETDDGVCVVVTTTCEGRRGKGFHTWSVKEWEKIRDDGYFVI